MPEVADPGLLPSMVVVYRSQQRRISLEVARRGIQPPRDAAGGLHAVEGSQEGDGPAAKGAVGDRNGTGHRVLTISCQGLVVDTGGGDVGARSWLMVSVPAVQAEKQCQDKHSRVEAPYRTNPRFSLSCLPIVGLPTMGY